LEVKAFLYLKKAIALLKIHSSSHIAEMVLPAGKLESSAYDT
jgi:hypothetical protein